MKIWANTIVHNEENFIWFSIMSVVDYVDKVLIWDTGSDDKTVQIIKEIQKIKGEKIIFKEIGEVNKNQFTKARQGMLDRSDCDWILVLDGDEIWWRKSIKKLVKAVNEKPEIPGIAVPMFVPVGDLYHFQEEAAGRYELLGRKGHLSLRAINKKIPSLHVDWPYGRESFLDENNLPIQGSNIIFLDAPFLHVTHLKRSGLKRKHNKLKLELGNEVSRDFEFPEVFLLPYPKIIASPWVKISGINLIKSRLLTPLRKLKRRFK